MTGRARVLTTLAVAGLVFAANSGLAGAGPADPDSPAPTAPAGTQDLGKDLANTCAFEDPVGAKPLSFHTSATLPAVVPSGQETKITGFTTKFVLPPEVVTAAAATSVKGTVSLELTADGSDKKSPVKVVLDIPETPVPAEGDLTLTATGEIPAFTTTDAGKLEFALGAPTLALTATLADSTTTAHTVACTLDPGQDAVLGTVVVLPEPKPGKDKTTDPVTPGGENGTNGAVGTQDEPDPDTFPINPQLLNGWSTVKKVGAKVTIGPAFMVNATVKISPEGLLIARGDAFMPPARVTFLAFGFMPTSATLELLPLDYQDSHMIPIEAISDGNTGTSHLDLMARLSDATVNGQPLDLGGDCVTATPLSLDLFGPYDAFTGGTLKTDPTYDDPKTRGFTLPPFKNCGATERLSPLLTGLSSGPDNQVEVHVETLISCEDGNRPPTQPPCPPG